MEELTSEEAVANFNMDRISKLPVHIIQQILSNLNSKESARTSFLSKSLFYAWSTRPVLEFCIACLNENSMESVNKSLQFYHNERLHMEKFKLHVMGPEDQLSYISVYDNAEKWLFSVVNVALCRGIVELDLSTDYIGLPFQDKRLNWCNLQKLKLEYSPIDDQTFSYLLSSCPLLISLHIEGCRELTKIPALKISNLREFYLICCEQHRMEEVDIKAPKLESFASTNVKVVNIDEGTSLKSLSLTNSTMRHEKLHSLLSRCPFLEDLSLNWCQEIILLVVSSNSIKFLRLNECHGLYVFDIDAPNLQLLEYKCSYKRDHLPFIISRASRKPKCCSITCWCENDSWFYSFFRQCRILRDFMTNFQSSTLTVQSWSNNEWPHNVDMSSWYDATALQPILEHDLESLTLEYDVINMVEIEGLLQMCRPKYVIIKYGDERDNHFIMRSLCVDLWGIDKRASEIVCYGGFRSRRSQFFCRCWRHYIKKAIIWYVVGNEYKPLTNYELLDLSTAAMRGKVEISFGLEWKQAPSTS